MLKRNVVGIRDRAVRLAGIPLIGLDGKLLFQRFVRAKRRVLGLPVRFDGQDLRLVDKGRGHRAHTAVDVHDIDGC